jgi:hypothetical protein
MEPPFVRTRRASSFDALPNGHVETIRGRVGFGASEVQRPGAVAPSAIELVARNWRRVEGIRLLGRISGRKATVKYRPFLTQVRWLALAPFGLLFRSVKPAAVQLLISGDPEIVVGQP